MHGPSQQYLDSCAYHEAGHTVVAVALEMPLRNRGVHIDTMGNGISYYWFRTVGDPNNAPADIAERERTIISTYAGYIAQKKSYPECPRGGDFFDLDQNIKLLQEMYAANRDKWFAEQSRLYAEATRLGWPSLARNRGFGKGHSGSAANASSSRSRASLVNGYARAVDRWEPRGSDSQGFPIATLHPR